MSRPDRMENVIIERIDASARRRKAGEASAAARGEKVMLNESAIQVVRGFAGDGPVEQRAERLEYLMERARDEYEGDLGADDAHPFLVGIGRKTGYRITTPPKKKQADAVFERAFKGEEGA